MQHDFAVKVAQAVECRDYAKRKAADEEIAKKRKRSKPHWAFEQKARWESKGNMQKLHVTCLCKTGGLSNPPETEQWL